MIIIIMIIMMMMMMIFLYIMEITRIFNMTVNLTYSPPVTTDNGYYRTIFGTYLQVMRSIGEEKPVLVLKH